MCFSRSFHRAQCCLLMRKSGKAFSFEIRHISWSCFSLAAGEMATQFTFILRGNQELTQDLSLYPQLSNGNWEISIVQLFVTFRTTSHELFYLSTDSATYPAYKDTRIVEKETALLVFNKPLAVTTATKDKCFQMHTTPQYTEINKKKNELRLKVRYLDGKRGEEKEGEIDKKTDVLELIAQVRLRKN